MRIVNETGPDIPLERGEWINRDRNTNTGLSLAVQMRADRLTVPLEMAGDRRDRPAPFPQRMGFHVFSLCEHGERGSFGLVGVRTASLDGAPPQPVDRQ